MNLCKLGWHKKEYREIVVETGFVKYHQCVKCGIDFCWFCPCKSIHQKTCGCMCHIIAERAEK